MPRGKKITENQNKRNAIAAGVAASDSWARATWSNNENNITNIKQKKQNSKQGTADDVWRFSV